jgi:N-acetylneuraminic acid mutarotase
MRPIPWLLVLVACGDDGSAMRNDAAMNRDAASSCEASSSWSTLPAVLGGAIQETAVVELDGKIYVIGGFNAELGVVASVRVFDTVACAWSDGPSLPRTIHHANAVVVGDTIYVLGGMDALSFTTIGDVYAWSPSSGATSWSTRASMPVGSERGAAVVGAIGDVVYVAGGLRSGAVATFSSYSTTGDTWETNLPPLPQPRDHGCGGVVGGKLYVVGGRSGGVLAADVFEYTPGGAWSSKSPMPTARGGAACGIAGDLIIVAGGEGNPATSTRVFAEVEAYTVSSNSWETLPAMATPRHGMGAAVSGDVFYVPGGATREAFGAVDAHEALRF